MSNNSKIILTIVAVVVVAGLIYWGITAVSQPRATNEPIKIGAILPLSGQNAVYGLEIKNAIELAKEKINDAGGINGMKLEVIYEDDQADPKLGTNAMQKLVTVDQVTVVLGSWASGVVIAAAPIAEQNQVVVMAEAISPTITQAGDYIFRIQPSAIFYTAKSAELLRVLKINTAAVIFINNDFGKTLKDSFVADFESRGGKVVSVESYTQGDTDFKSQLTKIKSTNPGVIFIPGYQDTNYVIKQIKELGIESKILAGPPFESKSTLDKLGQLAEGVLYPYHFVAGRDDPQAIEYEKNYLSKYGVPTGGFAPPMYDATYIIANALKKCESDTKCIKQELYQTNYDGVIGQVTFDANGDPIIPIVMKTVKDGQFVEYQ